MTLQDRGPMALDYQTCRYGASRLEFRGPWKRVTRDHVVCLGADETFGRFVPTPFPVLLEERLGLDCLNLGVPQAGPDLFRADASVLAMARSASVCVVQAMGAHRLSNRYFRVHPRRNDRFLAPTPLLQDLCPEIDFADCHFTGHVVAEIARLCPDRFPIIVREMHDAWHRAMTRLLDALPGPRVVLWFAHQAPSDTAAAPFVTPAMLTALRPHAEAVVTVIPSLVAQEEGAAALVHTGPDATSVAADMPGALAHQEAATALAPLIAELRR